MNNKYLPAWAFEETHQRIALRWIDEFENGIDQSMVPLLKKKGFSEDDIRQLLVRNPAAAFAIKIKRIA